MIFTSMGERMMVVPGMLGRESDDYDCLPENAWVVVFWWDE